MLTFTSESNILLTLCAVLLPKLGAMKTFPILMRSTPVHLGELNLQSVEVEALAQALHHLISLCTVETSTKLLLKTIIENHQLELGTDEQLFSLSYLSFGMLTAPSLITSLWQQTCHFNLHVTLPPLNLVIIKQEGDAFINEVVF